VNTQVTETYKLTDLGRNDLVSELYKRYGGKLFSYAVRTWNLSEDESWDLVYKTLYKVIDSFRKYSFENEEKFASFVFRVFINYLRNHYRDHKTDRENHPVRDIDPSALPDRPEIQHEEHGNIKLKVLKEELDRMEDWQRILLLMRSDGRPYSEIAQYVDKPEEQLKVYYQRLKKIISDKINEQIS
jgi:RNA polymerase sigma factor (sigma-70 family)